MVTKRKSRKPTKQDLEKKIAELEAKLASVSSQIEGKPTKTAPPPPKTEKPPPPQVQPQAGPPATISQALENAWRNAPMSSTHDYKKKVTGFSPNPNRYYARRIATIGRAPTEDWNRQKAKVTGFTQPSNQYFATRARLAYHPSDKIFTGYGMRVEGVAAQAQTQQAPPPPPPPPQAQQSAPPPQQTSSRSGSGKLKQQQLEEYERNYLARLEQQRIEDEEIRRAAKELAAKRTGQK